MIPLMERWKVASMQILAFAVIIGSQLGGDSPVVFHLRPMLPMSECTMSAV